MRPAQRRAFLCAAALGLVLSTGTAMADAADVEDTQQAAPEAAAAQGEPAQAVVTDDPQPAASEGSEGAAGPDGADGAAGQAAPPAGADGAVPEAGAQGSPAAQALPAWGAWASLSASEVAPGGSVTVSAGADASAGRVEFNYVWERDGWADWGSDVRDAGSFTPDASRVFAPSEPGSYRLYVDVRSADTGEVRTVEAGSLTVSARPLRAWASLSGGPYAVGSPVGVSPSASGASGALSYNYVWQRDGWAEWGSTVRDTGSPTSEASWSFAPPRAGTYTFYVDVSDAAGRTVTVEAGTAVVPAGSWTAGASVTASSLEVGGSARVVPTAAGASGPLSYNYVWQRDGWAEWGSTVRDTGGYTSDPSWAFSPSRPGSYRLYVDVVDGATGRVQTVEAGSVEVVEAQWSASVDLSSERVTAGTPVAVTPKVQGLSSMAGCTYNYVYNYNGTWDEWDSTVRRTGASTAQASWQFVPQHAGTYYLYVDVTPPQGQTRTVGAVLEVDAAPSCEGVEASAASITLGQSVTVTPKVNGSSAGFTFNYVWQRDGWADWNSTVKSTGGLTGDTSATFTPTQAGEYTFYVDVHAPQGGVTTYAVNVSVKSPDVVNVTDFQVTLTDGGSDVQFSLPAGSVPRNGAARVAVWADGAGEASAKWYDLACDADGRWSTTVSPSEFGTGFYLCRVYAKTASGDWEECLEQYFRLPLTPIMNASAGVDAQRLAAAYRRSGYTYPAKTYADKGAPAIDDFCTIIVSEARAEGVDPRVVYAQIMIETGGLQFGGDVQAGQCNFGGIGATGSGVAGNSFADVREGVRAQVQHLKAYASTAQLVNPVVDPRYTYVDHGVMPYVEGLGTRWAAKGSYGWDLASYISEI